MAEEEKGKISNREGLVRAVQAIALLLLVYLWRGKIWPFDLNDLNVRSFVDLFELLFADPKVIGLIRFAVILFSVFFIGSIISHIIYGRYLIKVSKQGWEVGDMLDNQANANQAIRDGENEATKIKTDKKDLQEELATVRKRLEWTTSLLEDTIKSDESLNGSSK